MTIGRAPKCDFVLEDNMVSRQHLICTKKEDGYHITNQSKINPTLVNGKECEDDYLLKNDDELTIGLTTFVFSSKENSSQSKKEKPIKSKKKNKDDIFSLPDASDIEKPKELAVPDNKEEQSQFDNLFNSAPDDVPSSLIPNVSDVFLKVIGGPNTGAEIIILPDKEYVLGKNPKVCDIVFQDLSVSKQHAKISIGKDKKISIEDLKSKNGVKVNDKLIKTKVGITTQDVISLGTTSFLIIDPSVQSDTIFDLPPEEKTEDKKDPEKKDDWKDKKVPTKFLVAGGAFGTVFLIIVVTFLSLFQSVPQQKVAPMSATKKLVSTIEKKYPALRTSMARDDNTILLAGHVISDMCKRELLFEIKEITPNIEIDDKIVVDEHITSAANKVLAENSMFDGISIFAPSPGMYTVQGYLTTNQAARALNDYILTSFPYPDRLTQKIHVENELLNETAKTLYSEGFTRLKPSILLGNLTIKGAITKHEVSQLKSAISKIEKIDGIRTVKNLCVIKAKRNIKGGTSVAYDDTNATDISDNYVLTGIALRNNEPFSAVINDKIYFMESVIDGMTIVNINNKSVLLEMNDEEFITRLKQ